MDRKAAKSKVWTNYLPLRNTAQVRQRLDKGIQTTCTCIINNSTHRAVHNYVILLFYSNLRLFYSYTTTTHASYTSYNNYLRSNTLHLKYHWPPGTRDAVPYFRGAVQCSMTCVLLIKTSIVENLFKRLKKIVWQINHQKSRLYQCEWDLA